MLANMSHGGKVAMLGIPSPSEMSIDWKNVIFNQLTIRGIYGREMYETWYKMTVMLESGLDISPIITHRFSWRDYEQGFDAMRSGNSGKVVLDWRDAGKRAPNSLPGKLRSVSSFTATAPSVHASGPFTRRYACAAPCAPPATIPAAFDRWPSPSRTQPSAPSTLAI